MPSQPIPIPCSNVLQGDTPEPTSPTSPTSQLARDEHAEALSLLIQSYTRFPDLEFTTCDGRKHKHLNASITNGSHSDRAPDPTPQELEAARAVLQWASNELDHHSEDSADILHNANMALLAADTLNRTFADLKSRSEDVRLRASYDLYGLVATASRGKLLGSLTVC